MPPCQVHDLASFLCASKEQSPHETCSDWARLDSRELRTKPWPNTRQEQQLAWQCETTGQRDSRTSACDCRACWKRRARQPPCRTRSGESARTTSRCRIKPAPMRMSQNDGARTLSRTCRAKDWLAHKTSPPPDDNDSPSHRIPVLFKQPTQLDSQARPRGPNGHGRCGLCVMILPDKKRRLPPAASTRSP